MADLRRNWFIEFEKRCNEEFADTFRGRRFGAWQLFVDEVGWEVTAWVPGAKSPALSETLPYNYLMFRPGTVAENIVTRLWEKALKLPPHRGQIAV
jgi:hypothetical protein